MHVEALRLLTGLFARSLRYRNAKIKLLSAQNKTFYPKNRG